MTEQDQNAASTESSKRAVELETNTKELLESLQRERASFLNYKRRTEQEREADRERVWGEVLLPLLSLLDELDRALGQRPKELESYPWAEGLALIHRSLTEALRNLRVEWIGTEGEMFDPAHHEAVFYEGRPDASDPRVAEVLRRGYKVSGRVLRPAQVSVVGPADTAAAEAVPRQATRSPESDSKLGG